MACPNCAHDNPPANRFCGVCGTALAHGCPSCDAEVPEGNAFCGRCGTQVGTPATTVPSGATRSAVVPGSPTSTPVTAQAERRHVSVLFVDLVGFTTLSEQRDPDAVRDLLSEYFDLATAVVGRYGGTIEKFIGDAVMAVWGTPVSREDDAERAVRAGLELIDAVRALGERGGHGELHARAGIATGEAAVRLDAVNQGMVAGDLVNTAARIQTAAEPGSVLVSEVTREASSRAISYAAAGEHQLKGKADPVRLFTALQVVAGGGGAQRSDGLEAPFTGRERDLRLVKELFHDGVEQSRARMVVVTGGAGSGKSRFGWEFFKYLDGLVQETLWHVGRCLAYGDGVAYWALAEVVRMRLRITEEEADDVALAKLDEGLAEYLDDVEERRWLRPRLAVLLGLPPSENASETLERETLFAGWRLFFERLARRSPVVVLLEDAQHADAGLLDFLDHLLEWSADLPFFVVLLARPELHDQRPTLGAQRRNVTVLHLAPLPDAAIGQIIDALVHGLPAPARAALATRSEGVPLFAVETVRMLIDRDIAVPSDGVYVLRDDAGDLTELDVPPTLQALVAARLDNLPEDERRLVKDMAVLGTSFLPAAVSALVRTVGGVDVDRVEALLSSLVRREVLTVQADARSPEAGQYRFVQKMMQTVAYETLSRRDRKARHLAAGQALQELFDPADIAAVIASHYLNAAEAVPDDPDADQLRSTAVGHLEAAGDRARSLAAPDEARRYYERALELTTSPPDRARLATAAGDAARSAGDLAGSFDHLAVAHRLHEERDERSALVRVAALEGQALVLQGRIEDALTLMLEVHERSAAAATDADLAQLSLLIAIALQNRGETADAGPWLERTIVAAEAAGSWAVLARALNVKGVTLQEQRRPVEGAALLRAALELGVAHGLHDRAAVQYANLANTELGRDLAEADRLAEQAVLQAARSGERWIENWAKMLRATVHLWVGRWDAIDVAEFRQRLQDAGAVDRVGLATPLVALSVWRQQPALLEGIELDLTQEFEDQTVRLQARSVAALLAIAQGDHEGCFQATREAVAAGLELGTVGDEGALELPLLVDSALATGRGAEAAEVLAQTAALPPGLVTPLLRSALLWLRGRLVLAGTVTDDDPGPLLTGGVDGLRTHGSPLLLGRALVDLARWHASQARPEAARDAATEAHELFTNLGARLYLASAEALLAGDRPAVLVADR
jgi:class 3 adenylate cyclase/predicted ATPase